MCGLAGMALRAGRAPAGATVDALTRALAHRGPDGAGHHVAGSVALAHTRLAIIDLATGDQPLFAGAAALVANGEVYNYRELREQHALHCATGSDCEPPLHLWRREGMNFAESLRGMYALALHDRASRQVVLARDPFGIKPLYVAEVEGGVAFASEPQALVAAGLVKPRVRREALAELLQIQFTTGAETIFEGVSRVLPGETVAIADGAIAERRRRDALPEGGPESIAPEAALARFDAAFEESVALHQRSDVPYGMFLSGGTDSAAVLAMMARLNESPVTAFTAGFDVPGAADERAAAAGAARAAGARHVTVSVDEAMVWRHLPEIVACMDDPAADYAIIPTWFLARRAREEVKVVLSGEGGDEVLGGYGRYRAAMRPWWLGGKAPRSRGSFDRLDDVLRAPLTGWRDGTAASEGAAATAGRTRLQAAQALDVADWLPNDLLIKLDRCLMAHGVEGRVPLLDTGVAAVTFRLPELAEGPGPQRQVAAAAMARGALPRRRALQAQAGLHRADRRLDRRRGRAARAAGRGAGRRRGDRPARPRGGAVPPRLGREAPRLRGVAPALLRAVAPPPCGRAAAGGRCVRSPGGALNAAGAGRPGDPRRGRPPASRPRPGTVSRGGKRARAEASSGERHRPALVGQRLEHAGDRADVVAPLGPADVVLIRDPELGVLVADPFQVARPAESVLFVDLLVAVGTEHAGLSLPVRAVLVLELGHLDLGMRVVHQGDLEVSAVGHRLSPIGFGCSFQPCPSPQPQATAAPGPRAPR